MDRTEKIDAAVAAAGELIGALETAGPVTQAQANMIVMASVRAAGIPNLQSWEVRRSAERIAAETEKYANQPSGE
jgi:hypothetical protein